MTSPPALRVHRSLRKSLRLLGADRLGWLDQAASMGPLVALQMGPLKAWVISDPGLARSILVTDSGSWTRPPTLVRPTRVAGGENLFNQGEPAWARLQPLLAPGFRKAALERRLAGIDALIAEQVAAIPLEQTVDLEL